MKFALGLLVSVVLATPVYQPDELEMMNPLISATTTAPAQSIRTPLSVDYGDDAFAPNFSLPEGATNAQFYCETAQRRVPGSSIPGASAAMRDAVNPRASSSNVDRTRLPRERDLLAEWSDCTLSFARPAASIGLLYVTLKMIGNLGDR